MPVRAEPVEAPPSASDAPGAGTPRQARGERKGIDLATLDADTIAARLSAPPEERAAFVRAAAEAGHAEAQAVLGQMLLDAGAAREGFGWFNRAAAQHHGMALNMVGRCYDLGWGVAVDKARAAACFRASAEAGLDWAMYNYGTALALGEGVAEDKAAALDWFHKAAALGNAKAMNHVGSFHEDGWVVRRDLTEAGRWYARAAEGGDFRGQFNHARLLGAAGRLPEALAWLGRVRETATPAFLDKAAAWLAAAPGFGDVAVRALRGEA